MWIRPQERWDILCLHINHFHIKLVSGGELIIIAAVNVISQKEQAGSHLEANWDSSGPLQLIVYGWGGKSFYLPSPPTWFLMSQLK